MSMSAQFGRWNLDGRAVDSDYLNEVDAALNRYGPDGRTSHDTVSLSIRYGAFHTTKESHSEVQPHVSACGVVLTWDGRLDNRAELISALGDPLTVTSADVAIVAAAYEKWGINCFGQLIGDWALSIWNPIEHSVLLAKDPIGTHHLYYFFDRDQITWSTVLDPLVRIAGRTFRLNEEYIAGWLSMFPATHLTPYVNVHSVPPSSLVVLGPGKHVVRRYWDFDPDEQIRYRIDAEYEEQFRTVFATAVRRRLRSDRPVLAELSGGRDSSSIVCMADEIIARSEAECPRLDTISYYDDSEPNWNERPYFAKVEAKRGRAGWHANVGSLNLIETRESNDRVEVHSPGDGGQLSSAYAACLASIGSRVVLSGIGGDEILGGVPTPIPNLQDLLVGMQLGQLTRELKIWALQTKKTWFALLWLAAGEFVPSAMGGIPEDSRPVRWFKQTFVKRQAQAFAGYCSRKTLFGPLPSFQENTRTLDVLRRQLACTSPPFAPPCEKRYPYLDRDLLSFMFAIPADQLVRPAQSRSLMRRALRGIVPDEILNRKAKAFVCRAPLLAISKNWSTLAQMTQAMKSDCLGLVDSTCLSESLLRARRGEQIPIIALLRTIHLERWLNELSRSGIVDLDAAQQATPTW